MNEHSWCVWVYHPILLEGKTERSQLWILEFSFLDTEKHLGSLGVGKGFFFFPLILNSGRNFSSGETVGHWLLSCFPRRPSWFSPEELLLEIRADDKNVNLESNREFCVYAFSSKEGHEDSVALCSLCNTRVHRRTHKNVYNIPR